MRLVLAFIITLSAIVINRIGYTQVCSKTSGVITIPSGSDPFCQTEPDYYAITITEMGLCTAAPTAPTTSSAIDLSSCASTFTSPGGYEVSVENGVSKNLAGSMSKPPNGAYTHGFIRMSNVFKIKAAITLNTSYNGVQSGSGIYCSTQAATYGEPSGSPPSGNSTVCSSTPTTAGILTDPLLDLSGGGSFEASGSETLSEGTITAYLLTSGSLLASSSANVAKMVGVQSFTTPVVISDNTSSMSVSFRVSQGMSVVDWGGAGYLDVGNGPFSVKMSVR